MEIHFLVEEPSAEAALREIAPKIIKGRARHKIINLNDKAQLLRKLPSRLAAYQQRIRSGEDIRICIIIDRDGDDCLQLKGIIETMIRQAGLVSKTQNGDSFNVLTRIACEELEAWFIGDAAAIRAAFTSLPKIQTDRGIFRQPDKTGRGTWEALAAFFKSHGLYRSHYPKIEGARKIAAQMNVEQNRSRSFQVFRSGVEAFF